MTIKSQTVHMIHHTDDIKKKIEQLLPQNNHVIRDEEIELKVAGKIDAVANVDLIATNKDGMKLYIVVKGSDTSPASIADVAMLKTIREKDRKNGKKQHRYMIFCEEQGNDDTKKLARGFNINYVNHDKYLKSELHGYFGDV